MRCLNAGSFRCASCSGHGLSMISSQAGRKRNGCTVPCQAMTMPFPRSAICATMLAPFAFCARISLICSASGSSLAIDCSAANVTGSPVSRESSPIHSNSFQSRFRSDAISNTPWPTRPMARPMPISSSFVAVVPGTSSPSTERCRIVREVEKPSAPARRPSSTICDMRAMSSRSALRCARRVRP